MANRTWQIDAIILHSRETSSGGRTLSLLSPEAGLVQAFLFGGAKSKLRSLASPWHAGRAWLYKDSSDFVKLTDFDAETEFPSIRQNLTALATASLLSEVLLATHCLGGDAMAAHHLAWQTLTGLESAGNIAVASGSGGAAAAGPASDSRQKARQEMVLLQMCLQVIGHLGLLGDPDCCERCAASTEATGARYYSRHHGGFVCRSCAAELGGTIVVPAGALAWQERSLAAGLPAAFELGLAFEARAAIRTCLVDQVSRAVQTPLKSLALL